jgi:hypothetical protein
MPHCLSSALVALAMLAAVQTSCNADELSSKAHPIADPWSQTAPRGIEEKGTFIIPEVIPPPKPAPPLKSPDSRCRELTEEQRKTTPGC